MKLNAVMDEVAVVLREITGFKTVLAYPPETITPPAAYVSYPQSILFDQVYDRGQDDITDIPIVILGSKVTSRTARDQASEWSSGDGPLSVKKHMEDHRWTSCDDLTVTSVEFDVERVAGIDYLAVMFKATAVGPGED